MRIFTILSCVLLLSNVTPAFELRVLTYNIHHAEGTDGVLDIDRIVGVIRASKADIVCLQEVDQFLSRTERMDMPDLFRKKLGMNGVFGANYHFDDGHYGNLTLSRFPIAASTNIVLPNPFGDEPRGWLTTVVSIPLGGGSNAHTNVDVCNTHFGLKSEERRQQALDIVSSLPSNAQAIVAGDLNETTEAAGVQLLLEKLIDSDEADVKTKTIPSKSATKRIDYILHRGFSARSLSIVNSEHSTIASDHLPLVAEFQLNP